MRVDEATEYLRIRAAAALVGRSMDTLRDWADAGRASTGDRLHVARDPATGERYFRRPEIERVRASLQPREP